VKDCEPRYRVYVRERERESVCERVCVYVLGADVATFDGLAGHFCGTKQKRITYKFFRKKGKKWRKQKLERKTQRGKREEKRERQKQKTKTNGQKRPKKVGRSFAELRLTK
jgi:hypothetical protein